MPSLKMALHVAKELVGEATKHAEEAVSGQLLDKTLRQEAL
jgi:hypothetical protein